MTEAQQAKKTFVSSYIRAIGAVLMLTGMALAFNLGGSAAAIGFAGMTGKIFGGIRHLAGHCERSTSIHGTSRI